MTNLFFTALMGILLFSSFLLTGCITTQQETKILPVESPVINKKTSEVNNDAVDELQNDPEGAIIKLESALRANPNSVEIEHNLASAYEKNDNLSKARDQYTELSKRANLPEDKATQYLLRALDLNIKLAEQHDDIDLWSTAKVNDVLATLNGKVSEDTYVKRIDLLRGYYDIDPIG